MSNSFIINDKTDRSMTTQYQIPEVLAMRFQHKDNFGQKKK